MIINFKLKRWEFRGRLPLEKKKEESKVNETPLLEPNYFYGVKN